MDIEFFKKKKSSTSYVCQEETSDLVSISSRKLLNQFSWLNF